ncbi:MAG: hypothetical protein HZA01_04180 [Nitrospinae bacterium]|nr:hypothetical protein [Nitrospinota bacterium]
MPLLSTSTELTANLGSSLAPNSAMRMRWRAGAIRPASLWGGRNAGTKNTFSNPNRSATSAAVRKWP